MEKSTIASYWEYLEKYPVVWEKVIKLSGSGATSKAASSKNEEESNQKVNYFEEENHEYKTTE